MPLRGRPPVPGVRKTIDMQIAIGFVSSSGSDALAAPLRELVPAGVVVDVLDIAEAILAVAEGRYPVMVVVMDHDDWASGIAPVLDLHAAAVRHPLAVLALVPRSIPGGLARALEMQVADAAGLPMDPDEVRARLALMVRRRQLALTRAAEARALLRLAMSDPVTGLGSRHLLEQVLPQHVGTARADGSPLAALMIDLDGLKLINDRLGHVAGDRALRAVAEALRAELGPNDRAIRYGGDELLVLLPGSDAVAARALAGRLLAAVRSWTPTAMPDGGCLTVSVGVAVLGGDDDSGQALVRRADLALLTAKRAGRNRFAEAA